MQSNRIIKLDSQSNELHVTLGGKWSIKNGLSQNDALRKEIEKKKVNKVVLSTKDLSDWDTSLLTFLCDAYDICKKSGIQTDTEGLHPGLKSLLELSTAVPEAKGAKRSVIRTPFLEGMGEKGLALLASMGEYLNFLGQAAIDFTKFLRGKATFRRADLMVLLQDCGFSALPIVTLTSFLIGIILAYIGAAQLANFGATIFVADLVGIAMVREMAPIMTAIIMAGRTGASFAAQLGTMKVTQETDAFETFGFSVTEFLVLPRMLALIIMMPLLVVYANFVGMLAGAFISVSSFDLTLTQYYHETIGAVGFSDIAFGLVKASIFGAIVAVSGCLRGLQCGKSASAVGDAATSAAVTSIILILTCDGVFAVLSNILGI